MSDADQTQPPSRGPRLPRFWFVVWLLLPLVVIGILALMIDRNRAKPRPMTPDDPPHAAH